MTKSFHAILSELLEESVGKIPAAQDTLHATQTFTPFIDKTFPRQWPRSQVSANRHYLHQLRISPIPNAKDTSKGAPPHTPGFKPTQQNSTSVPPGTATNTRASSSSAAPLSVQEPTVRLADLPPASRTLALRMVALGALELQGGLSATLLRAAFRRLAKQLHPDCPNGSAASFRELHNSYAKLQKLLKEMGTAR